jgi:hypothetical protein
VSLVYGLSKTPGGDVSFGSMLSKKTKIKQFEKSNKNLFSGPLQNIRGSGPAELHVQLPVKFEMSLNVKTARALGLAVPQSILLQSDEVIE